MSAPIQYPDDFVERLHILWGDGFLGPGGPQEVQAILRGIDVEGREVLDIGGTGGSAMVIARDLGAGPVTAVDGAGGAPGGGDDHA